MIASAPVMDPTAFGTKLSTSVQEAPGANVPALEFGEICGQVELLLSSNPLEIAGFRSVAGTGKVRGALPLLVRMIVCGLSLLVALTAVDAKVSVGGSAKANFVISPAPVLLTRRLPLGSAHTPVEFESPVMTGVDTLV